MSDKDKCPGCGAEAICLVPIIWACGRTSERVGVDVLDCAIRQLAEKRKLAKQAMSLFRRDHGDRLRLTSIAKVLKLLTQIAAKETS